MIVVSLKVKSDGAWIGESARLAQTRRGSPNARESAIHERSHGTRIGEPCAFSRARGLGESRAKLADPRAVRFQH